MLKDYDELIHLLGNKGSSKRTAEKLLLDFL
jgi:hypothetical protein